MPELSRNWLATVPSITKFWLWSCILTTTLFTLPSLPVIGKIPFADYLNASHLSLDWSLIQAGQVWRLVTPFLVVGALVPGMASFTAVTLAILGVNSRQLEDTYYASASGAAHYTTTLVFGAAVLLALTRTVETPFLALPLVFFMVTHYTTLDPYQPLYESEVLLRWHLPYLLLALIVLTAPAMTGQAFVGILIAYGYHLLTVRLHESSGLRLWGTPSSLVLLYEKLGIGKRKHLFMQRSEPHSMVSEPAEAH